MFCCWDSRHHVFLLLLKKTFNWGLTYSFSLGYHHHGREHDGRQVFAAGDLTESYILFLGRWHLGLAWAFDVSQPTPLSNPL